MMAPPKFATARDLAYPTTGGLDAEFARVWMRHPLLEWQRYVADVAGEYDPDTGLPRRSLVVVSVQRQAGKSDLAMAKNGRRCFTNPGHRAWYTAQSGQDARDQFLKFHDDTLAGTPLATIVRVKRGNGHESMEFPNGSTLRPHPPTEDAMHGKQSDGNDVDEGWAFPEERGQLLMQAIAPTQLTRPGAQTWVWSAGGTASSTWLAGLVARGRAGDPGIAFFEWGIPDTADPEDLDVVAAHHPAYGSLITRESLASLRTTFGTDVAGWARAAGNRWTEVIGGAIPAAVWADAQAPHLVIPDAAPVGYGAARAADGSAVVIVAAGLLEDGRILLEVIDVVPAFGAAPVLAHWAGRDRVTVLRSGASAVLADDLGRERVNLDAVTERDYTAACADINDRLAARRVLVRPAEVLDAAVKVAARRRVASGGFAWTQTAAGSIAALEAATMATRSLAHRPPPTAAPVVVFA